LVKNVADQLVLGFFEGSARTAALRGQERTLAAVKAVHDLYPAAVEVRLRHHLNKLSGRLTDGEQQLFFPFIEKIPVSWDLLERDQRDHLAQIIRMSEATNATTAVLVTTGLNLT
jgi:hypothetical protein